MKNEDEVQRQAARQLIKRIARLDRKVRLMEVCGTHTVAIFRAGIRQLLPEQVELVSGPGCPVCVTANDFLDQAIAYGKQSDVIITTFGDMLRVPGSAETLQEAKAAGADIRIVYSPLESLTVARENPAKTVIFLAVGFETTTPTAAATIEAARQEKITNFTVLTAHKLVPPVLKTLLADPATQVDGLLLPGHVCAITGTKPFEFVPKDYEVPAVVAGFEALDILQSVAMLADQILRAEPKVENQYARVVKLEGNPVAAQLASKVYQPVDAKWRGFGTVEKSGLELRETYATFDIRVRRPLTIPPAKEAPGCRCGEVLKGAITPVSCPLFRRVCRPESPVGACMVSVEGTCAAWYKYGDGRWKL